MENENMSDLPKFPTLKSAGQNPPANPRSPLLTPNPVSNSYPDIPQHPLPPDPIKRSLLKQPLESPTRLEDCQPVL
jgi:hypothetical protein